VAETVNAQVVDSVTSANVKVLGDAPSVAVSLVYSSLSNCVSLTMANATTTQAGMQQIGAAVVTVGVVKIMQTMK
jgi:hypothetical protein